MRSKHQQKDGSKKISMGTNLSEVTNATPGSESLQEQRDDSGDREARGAEHKIKVEKQTNKQLNK